MNRVRRYTLLCKIKDNTDYETDFVIESFIEIIALLREISSLMRHNSLLFSSKGAPSPETVAGHITEDIRCEIFLFLLDKQISHQLCYS